MQHSAIPDAQLHEPKGVASASAGQIYIADGAGSGAWTGPVYGELYIAGNALTFTPVAADITQYKKIASTGWAVGQYLGLVLNTDDITLDGAGVYELHFWCNILTSAADGTKFAVKFALDGTTNPRKLEIQKNSTGTDYLTFSAQGLVSATAGQVLSIHLASSASTVLTIEDAGFSVIKIK